MHTRTRRKWQAAMAGLAATALAFGWSGAAEAAASPAASAATGPAHGPNLSCGEVITASVTLTANLTCAGTGLIVDPDADVTLNLGGHTITGNGTGSGVELQSADVPLYTYTVEDGTITSFSTGVFAADNESADVTDVKLLKDGAGVTVGPVLFYLAVAGSKFSGDQYDFEYTSNSMLQTIDVSGSTIDGGLDGFSTGTGEAIYTSNHITDSEMSLNTPGNDTIEHNVLVDSEVDEQSFGSELQIEDNTMEDASVGLVDSSFGDDTISGNTFKDDGIGAEILEGGGADDTVSGNKFLDNSASGLYIDNQTQDTTGTVSSNTANGNGHDANGQVDADGHLLADGITVDQSGDSVTVTGNHTSDNDAFGIWLDATGAITNGGGNTSSGNPQKCNPTNLCTY